MKFNLINYLKKVYKYHFLPELVVALRFQKVYATILHIPVFFCFVFFTIAFAYKKFTSYFQTWENPTWDTIAHIEGFYLCWLIFPLFAVLFRLRGFYYITSITLIFYIYLVVSTIYPPLGKWIAEHEAGHLIDALILLWSLVLGHYIDLYINTVIENGKRRFIHYKNTFE